MEMADSRRKPSSLAVRNGIDFSGGRYYHDSGFMAAQL